mmetsp:Transcript_18214/g.45429  ORF Transcript_18214/g.45429 Transcript_18214/m.45429 type:complete len:200 (+) Transcript_18214:90-689(+)
MATLHAFRRLRLSSSPRHQPFHSPVLVERGPAHRGVCCKASRIEPPTSPHRGRAPFGSGHARLVGLLRAPFEGGDVPLPALRAEPDSVLHHEADQLGVVLGGPRNRTREGLGAAPRDPLSVRRLGSADRRGDPTRDRRMQPELVCEPAVGHRVHVAVICESAPQPRRDVFDRDRSEGPRRKVEGAHHLQVRGPRGCDQE